MCTDVRMSSLMSCYFRAGELRGDKLIYGCLLGILVVKSSGVSASELYKLNTKERSVF